MQSLAEFAKESFDSHIRTKGLAFVQGGKVQNEEHISTRSQYRILDARAYRCSVDWTSIVTKKQILLKCDCPAYEGGSFCQHLWAAILDMEKVKKGPHLGTARPGSIQILHAWDITDTKSGDEEVEKEDLLSDLQDDDDDDDEDFFVRRSQRVVPATKKETRPKSPWEIMLEEIDKQNVGIDKKKKTGTAAKTDSVVVTRPRSFPTIYYVVNPQQTQSAGEVVVDFFSREKAGGNLKSLKISADDITAELPAIDKEILSLMFATGLEGISQYSHVLSGAGSKTYSRAKVRASLNSDLLPKLSATGRLMLAERPYAPESAKPVLYEDHEPWRVELVFDEEKKYFVLHGYLTRGDDRRDVEEPLAIMKSGVVIFRDHLASLEAQNHIGWIQFLRQNKKLEIPEGEIDRFVERICGEKNPPSVHWPKTINWQVVAHQPEVVIGFSLPPVDSTVKGLLIKIDFSYDSNRVSALNRSTQILDAKNRQMIQRDLDLEESKISSMRELKYIEDAPGRFRSTHLFRLNTSDFVACCEEIQIRGWKLEAQGKKLRRPTSTEISITTPSNADWFDLNAAVRFEGGPLIPLPVLLSARERGEFFITLDDGSLGMLPEEWLERMGPLASLGQASADAIRYKKSQAALIHGWLGEKDQIKVDKSFTNLQKQLESYQSLKAKTPVPSFKGVLRTYQQEGIAWLAYLRESSFGGILADDMGLGKTVQMLAHLEGERIQMKGKKGSHLPSIIVVPKSLVFNWVEESKKFAPELKVINYSGADRAERLGDLKKADLVVTTYSTLRLDIDKLKNQEFHYVIADEAQAIKNAKSQASRACRVLKGRHRLVLTGTPVENSVQDLFSILDFVNPGLISRTAQERIIAATSDSREKAAAVLGPLAKALKPFILRRTKSQVLKDLPEKTEKVLHCEMSPSEKKFYDELRDFYRQKLTQKVEEDGMGKSKLVVLEALLRLRQAACHPGLVNPDHANENSTKLETLIGQIQEVISEGHKCLVFSQFTSFLDIVRKAFDREGIKYEYLDGKTQDRQERVRNFQENKEIPVFLISLKAGGVGLNLTAADYVFILDPWWNPAVESQAIDRSHRMGQKNKVIAYRLIAQGTVEEKIIELQSRKRGLAESIISEDAGPLKSLTTEDLQMLLS